jgi:probable rRNA maturation factor
MKSAIRVEIVDHQRDVSVPAATIKILEAFAKKAWPMLADLANSPCALDELEEISVAFVNEYDSARVHLQFMGVAGSTDVITFEHGELLICPAVAMRQAEQYAEPVPRELFRYIVHGMLHLAGYEDDSFEKRKRMEDIQENMILVLWKDSAAGISNSCPDKSDEISSIS